MLDAAGRAEVGLAPLLVHGHAAGHLVQALKVLSPKELVKVEVTVIALGRACVAAQKVQRGAVGQNDGIALQLHARDLMHEGTDVLFEDMRLCLAG